MNKRGQLIIFGWGRTTRKIEVDVPIQICEHCHSNYLYFTRVTKWFTLFFIPIIPYKTIHYFLCPHCEYGFEIKSEKVEEIKEKLEKHKKPAIKNKKATNYKKAILDD